MNINVRLASVVLVLCFVSVNVVSQQVSINEIMTSNAFTIADEDGDYEDWIEIYNYGDEAVNLLNYGLSDDYSNPYRWVFPDTTLLPGEFLLIWASGKDRKQAGMPLHTNFSISSSGEEVLLTHPNGELVDEHPPVSIPTDISFGRQPDGTGPWFYFQQPTPEESNTTQPYEAPVTQPYLLS